MNGYSVNNTDISLSHSKNNRGLDASLEYSIAGKFDEAKNILLSLDQTDPRVRFNLGWYSLKDGDLLQGFENMDYGRRIGAFGGATNFKNPLYNGECIKNKTLLFVCEGGLGDEIINIRFVKNFKDLGAKVIVGCSNELFCIFKELDHIHGLIDRSACIHTHHDYWVPAMSAPMHLNMKYPDLDGNPYLNFFSKRWVPKNDSRFKVGIRWAGSPKFEHQQHRKFPIEKILELTEIGNMTFYSLQRDQDLIESDSFIDMQYEMKTWKDTADIIASMDLIITSCTSIAHLSAAMGKPTWVIIPLLPYYVWARPGNKSPWYNVVKLYRQEERSNWDAPFKKIKNDLLKISDSI